MMGHNGGPSIFESVSDLPSDMPKMHYFKCDIQALRKAIFDKPLDIRGAYISVLVALYEHQEPLPAEDGMAMLRCGIKDARIWRRIKSTLVDLGLIYQRSSGRLSNTRFEEEIGAYVTEFRNRQNAAIEREKKAKVARAMRPSYGVAKPQLSDSYGLANAQLTPSYPIANGQLKASKSEKTNEINVGATTTVPERSPQADHETPLRARVLQLELESKRKNNPPPTTESVAASVGGIAGALEGETDIGNGLYVSDKMIRHAEFVISIDGVFMQTLNCGLSKNEIIEVCKGIAIQWALDISVGKPFRIGNVAQYLASSVRKAASDRAQHGVRMARTARGHDNREQAEKAETQSQAMKRKFAEAERAAVAKGGSR